MATINIKLKDVIAELPKIMIGGNKKNDKHKERQKKPVRKFK